MGARGDAQAKAGGNGGQAARAAGDPAGQDAATRTRGRGTVDNAPPPADKPSLHKGSLPTTQGSRPQTRAERDPED